MMAVIDEQAITSSNTTELQARHQLELSLEFPGSSELEFAKLAAKCLKKIYIPCAILNIPSPPCIRSFAISTTKKKKNYNRKAFLSIVNRNFLSVGGFR